MGVPYSCGGVTLLARADSGLQAASCQCMLVPVPRLSGWCPRLDLGAAASRGASERKSYDSLTGRLYRDWSLVFGGCAFPPVSLGPAGDCPRKD